jgi:hypothetical protein
MSPPGRRFVFRELAVNHKQTVSFGLVCIALIATAYSVAAAEDVPSTVATNDTIQVPPIDEIIVNGQRDKLSKLRVEIDAAEDAFYEAINQVNTERQYHTFCDIETATEMRQKVHVCKPEFVSDAYGEAMAEVMMGGGDLGSALARAASLINTRMPLYKAHLHELVQKNPKVGEALGRYYALTQHYAAVRKEKFKGKWIVWD